jgi:hypothetical protein
MNRAIELYDKCGSDEWANKYKKRLVEL